jgi:hypothetical protein
VKVAFSIFSPVVAVRTRTFSPKLPRVSGCSRGTSLACRSIRSSMRRTPRCSAAVESMGRSIGLRGLSFLPNAVDWAAVHQGRVGSPTGIVCRPPTSSTRGADLTGRTEQQLLESCYRSRLDITCRQGFQQNRVPGGAGDVCLLRWAHAGCLPGCARGEGLLGQSSPGANITGLPMRIRWHSDPHWWPPLAEGGLSPMYQDCAIILT